MTKDEMKNRISMALKDPILQQGFEIICKENAEAKNLIEELASSLSVVGECDVEECNLINKAQKFINKPIF